MGEHYFSIVILALMLCSPTLIITTTAFIFTGTDSDQTGAVADVEDVLESPREVVVPPHVVVVFDDVTGFPDFDEELRRRSPIFRPRPPQPNTPSIPVKGYDN
ncbi:hypothetical protein Sjap_026369 [Stephania japonica]|uniref:Uncharacterized protein n=1 Tax=Stephania japonica TaxID=461633 RepID=A0AAP0EBA2_9MAGN